MNESTDASRILFKPPSEVWRKPRRRPRNSWVRTVTNDLANSYTGLPEQLRTGSTGGCLRSIAQRTRSGACSYWIGLDKCNVQHWTEYKITLMRLFSAPETQLKTYMVRKTGAEGRRQKMESIYGTDFSGACVMGKTVGRQKRYIGQGQHSSIRSLLRRHWL